MSLSKSVRLHETGYGAAGSQPKTAHCTGTRLHSPLIMTRGTVAGSQAGLGKHRPATVVTLFLDLYQSALAGFKGKRDTLGMQKSRIALTLVLMLTVPTAGYTSVMNETRCVRMQENAQRSLTAEHGRHQNHQMRSMQDSAHAEHLGMTTQDGNDCTCGCNCMSHHCASNYSGFAADTSYYGVALLYDSGQRLTRRQTAPIPAHHLDLLRPPITA